MPEPINWNEVKMLLETQDKKLEVIAEGVSGLRSEFETFKTALFEVAEDVKLMKPAVLKNTRDITEIKDRLERIEKRLESAEAKLPA